MSEGHPVEKMRTAEDHPQDLEVAQRAGRNGKTPLRVLIAEDTPADAELVVCELLRAGFEPAWERVDTEAEFRARLHAGWDIVLSDYDMPQFSGRRALEVLNESGLDIPFIIISGTIGEDIAVDVMKLGASDYLLKDRLTRLRPAIEQALEKGRLRRERKQTEAALRQSEAEFRAVSEASPFGIFVTDCDGLATYTNARFRQMLGAGFQEIAGTGWARSLHPQDRAELLAQWQKAIAGRQNFAGSARFVRPDGTVIQTSIKTAVMRERDRILEYVGAVEDITEHKQSEETLRESEERFSGAFEHAPIGVALVSPDGRWLKVNRALCDLVGYSEAELLARTFQDITHPEDLAADLENARRMIAGEIRTSQLEKRHVHARGHFVTVLLSVSLVRDGQGGPRYFIAQIQDITERKQLEAQLLRSQRMESIGTLAGGIAHDLNNILSPIMMSVPMLRRDMSAEEREGIISTIEMSAERGAQIVKQVLTFGRGLEGDRCPLQVGALIDEIVKIIHGIFPKNITIEKRIGPGLWPMLGDATQMHQVLLNLCINARDAMPDGGQLRLSVRNFVLDAHASSMMPGTTPGPYVLLEANDNGSGIAPEIVERIFDPFFTTKGIGQGTGLGLSTVLGIVKSHGGHISVTSAPGRGTTFQIYLPASADDQDAQSRRGPMADPPHGHGESVLVVDDEEAVRHAARTVLEAHGYRVLLAADGMEALAVFARNSASVSAVLTDLMMPLMDGGTLIKALRQMQPGLAIIASTGLGEKSRIAELAELNVKIILNKPYAANALLHAVHEAIRL